MSTSKIAITIGAYRLAEFVQLNIRACRQIFGDVPILVSDDASPESGAIQSMAEAEQVDYICSPHRMSHCSGDWQAFINGQAYAEEVGAEIAIKLSQRLIPLDTRVRDLLLQPLEDHRNWAVLPTAMHRRNLARSGTQFYANLPVLTDIVAWRVSRFSPQQLLEIYRDRAARATRETSNLQVVEHTWHHIMEGYAKDHVVLQTELANPAPMAPKIYLRKAQCNRGEYLHAAERLGVAGTFDVREWNKIEDKGYKCRPDAV